MTTTKINDSNFKRSEEKKKQEKLTKNLYTHQTVISCTSLLQQLFVIIGFTHKYFIFDY